jgi:hypothetical protein
MSNATKKPERIEVLKKTQDDWYPSILTDNGHGVFVRVTFLEFPKRAGYRVCVWGNDDFGLEQDFTRAQRERAYALFIDVISKEYVSQAELKLAGFVNA